MTTLSTQIRTLFSARGTVMVDVPVLQPADPFLDMAGEDLRRRIFLTESETGEQLCLRPEFTIPVCLDHIASRAGTPRRYGYVGEVFRQRRDGPAEFMQAGIEDLGDPEIARADARAIADAHALLAHALPDAELSVTVGDHAVFEAVLAALGLPPGWQKRLARAFGAPEQLSAALADLSGPPAKEKAENSRPDIVASGLDALTAHIAAEMEKTGLSTSASRTPEEIARRLIEKTELQKVRLPDEALSALKTFLDIDAPLAEAPRRLQDFADEAGLVIDRALVAFSQRALAILAEGLPAASIRYDAAFGRPLDYYTGLVFEIAAPGEARPLAGGGRYDRLLTMLGATAPIPGVGFSVWLDRIEALRGGQG
ncbi:ATP phosphoribosyltransferase regulatory subunit [Pseudaminobacter sp. 19-2017]|uniref:ATP phosphoribosyltransferase regulatory subunit n=2 Tax=Pseudaminobacter soli (ex Zhang et al. 2022) TaxID=2831468 RepID=A0A942I8N1_9HYPH|nr:ATP phosphoribosyltransferase regulatory subunit [Pseudaminobacter soli]MBS3648411.1 ATP phosphoribosyltransferase regulatory subunit [Pseudaminobacter soli]